MVIIRMIKSTLIILVLNLIFCSLKSQIYDTPSKNIGDNQRIDTYFFLVNSLELHPNFPKLKIIDDSIFEYTNFSNMGGIATVSIGKVKVLKKDTICIFSQKDRLLPFIKEEQLFKLDRIYFEDFNGQKLVIIDTFFVKMIQEQCKAPQADEDYEKVVFEKIIPDSLKQKNSGLKSYQIPDLQWADLENGENVYNLCDGIVSSLMFFPSDSTFVVRIVHGNVYSHIVGLSKVFIHEGQTINAGNPIGIKTDKSAYFIQWMNW